MRLDPAEYAEGPLPVLRRPRFLAIVSSNTLAATMLRRASGRVDGLVIESPTAGGHNAPPRGKLQLNATGEPVYGERDRVNIEELRTLGVPFWLAGGYGTPAMLREALDQGAMGVQAGTAFAFSRESGLRPDLKIGFSVKQPSAPDAYLPIRWPRPPAFHLRSRILRALRRRSTSIRAQARLRSWLLTGTVHRAGRCDRLSLLGRTGGKLCCQRRQGGGDSRPQVPVQCSAGQCRSRSGAHRRRCRACTGHGWRRPEHDRHVSGARTARHTALRMWFGPC